MAALAARNQIVCDTENLEAIVKLLASHAFGNTLTCPEMASAPLFWHLCSPCTGNIWVAPDIPFLIWLAWEGRRRGAGAQSCGRKHVLEAFRSDTAAMWPLKEMADSCSMLTTDLSMRLSQSCSFLQLLAPDGPLQLHIHMLQQNIST